MVAGNGPHEYRIVFTKGALKNLVDLTTYIAQNSPQNAMTYGQRIVDAIDGLRFFPNRTLMSGQSTKLPSPIRTLPIESHVVYFRVNERHRTVDVIRILHGARRRPKRL